MGTSTGGTSTTRQSHRGDCQQAGSYRLDRASFGPDNARGARRETFSHNLDVLLLQHPTQRFILRAQFSIAFPEFLQLGLRTARDAFLESRVEPRVYFVSECYYRGLPEDAGSADGEVQSQLPALNSTNTLSDVGRNVFPGSEHPSSDGLVLDGGCTLQVALRHSFLLRERSQPVFRLMAHTPY
jgi:hypothetical protein